MNETIRSNLTGHIYRNDESINIVNVAQAAFYMENNLMPLDIYPSKDYKTKKPIMVFTFNKEETKPLFDQWCNRTIYE